MKKIAILLATYNGEEYIEEQLNSIVCNISKLDQDRYHVDVMISDDASTDRTLEIINKLRENYEYIHVIDFSKKGSAIDNFSFLIKNVPDDYDFYFFSDQDDFWLPHKLAIFLNEFESTDNSVPTLIHSDLSVVNNKLFPINHSMFNFQKINKHPNLYNLILQNSITGCVMAINKPLLIKARNSSIEKSIMHDWYLGLIALAFGNVKFIDYPTILYRQHSNNEVGAKRFNYIYVLNRILNIRETICKIKYSLKKIDDQARLFISDFESQLKSEDERKINLFLSNSKLNRFLCFFYGFKKNGFVRNIAYILFIL